MNLQVLEPLTATGAEQAVAVPRGYRLTLTASAACELRSVSAGPYFPIAANTVYQLAESLGQTIYLTAAAGTTIRMAYD